MELSGVARRREPGIREGGGSNFCPAAIRSGLARTVLASVYGDQPCPTARGRPNCAKSARHRPTARSMMGSSDLESISPPEKVVCWAGQRFPQSARLVNRRHDGLRSRSRRTAHKGDARHPARASGQTAPSLLRRSRHRLAWPGVQDNLGRVWIQSREPAALACMRNAEKLNSAFSCKSPAALTTLHSFGPRRLPSAGALVSGYRHVARAIRFSAGGGLGTS